MPQFVEEKDCMKYFVFLYALFFYTYLFSKHPVEAFYIQNSIPFVTDKKDTVEFNNMATIENKEFINVMINGSAQAENVTIKEHLQLNGVLVMKNGSIGTLRANGSVFLTEVDVTGSATINGYLELVQSKVQDLDVTVSKFIISSSSIQNLIIHKTNDLPDGSSLTIELDNSKVTGTIIFDRNVAGVVVLKNGALVEGKVEGGRIQHA